MTLEDIMNRLVAEGYENCHYDGSTQIIVNNRGEVELMYGEAQIYDRLAPWPGYGNHKSHMDIDSLFADINATWAKAEFPKVENDSEDNK
jgi:hypothetical protein